MFKKKNQSPYDVRRPRNRGLRRVLIVGLILVFLFAAAAAVVRHEYYQDLRPVSSSDQTEQVTIADGMTTPSIAKLLEQKGLIRSSTVFEWYVSSHGARSDLQAGTYDLKPSMTLPAIVNILTDGKIATNLVTILPGQRLSQIRTALISSGFSAASVDTALSAANYPGTSYPALADKPASASLEGFLYPDTFERDSSTSPTHIVSESLTEMGQHLTPDVRSSFAGEGLSVFQGVTLASIVEQEVSNNADRAQAAQVFLSRLKIGMPLGSDATARYGAIIAGQPPSINYVSLYNTYIHKGLPPGPISNVSESSLEAVAHPANTSWLYFVTGDNGKTYFSKTAAEHDQQTAQYCHKLCSETPQ